MTGSRPHTRSSHGAGLMQGNASSGAPVRVLCLHPFRTSGSIFRRQCHGVLREAANRDRARNSAPTFHFAFPDAPHAASGPPDPIVQTFFPGEAYREWWDARRDEGTGLMVYAGKEASVSAIRRCWEVEGPFDGVLAFSQGGMLASHLLASPSLRQEMPFRWGVLVGAMAPRDADLDSRAAFHKGDGGEKISEGSPRAILAEIPSLHVIGATDTMSPLSHALAERFGGRAETMVWAGGHSVPPRKEEAARIVDFMVRHSAGASE